MKSLKYLAIGAMIMGLSAPVMAQTVDYKPQLEAITKVISNEAAAKPLIKEYLKSFKKNPAALVALGNAYLMAKECDKATRESMALQYADMALARNKNYGDAFILKGDIEAINDDGGEAAMWYQQAMMLDPQNPEGYMRYANVNRKVSPEESARVLNELRKIRPDYPVDAETAHSYYTANKFDKALEYFAKCDINQLDEGKLVEYLVSAVQLNKYADALKIADFGGKKFTKNATFAQLGLWSAVETESFQAAEAYANRYLAMEGEKNATDHTYHGKALVGLQRYEEAIEKFNKALEANPEATEPLARISETYTKMGQEDKALEYSEKYLAKNKNANILDYANLAQIYVNKAEKGDKVANYEKALAIYDQMVTKFPDYASWTNGIAAGIADKAGKEDLGAQYNQKIVDELGGKASLSDNQKGYLMQALRKLGYYYWGEKNNLDAAKPYYEQLIKLDPNDKNAKAALGIE